MLSRLRQRGERADIAGNLKQALPDQEFRGAVHAVEHHLCHLASAFLVSPYDKAVAVSVDGFGDFSSAAWGLGGHLSVDGRVYFPIRSACVLRGDDAVHRLPALRRRIQGDGARPYGEPRFVDLMKQIVKTRDDGTFALDLRFFRHASGEGANYQVKDGIPSGGRLWSDERMTCLALLAIRQRRWRIAIATSRARRRSPTRTPSSICWAPCTAYGADAVVLAGGCACNSVANCQVLERSPFKKLYVQSAGGDAGGAIGAAFATWHKLGGANAPPLRHGPRLLGSVRHA